jgi:hypothetical protein
VGQGAPVVPICPAGPVNPAGPCSTSRAHCTGFSDGSFPTLPAVIEMYVEPCQLTASLRAYFVEDW